MAGRWTELGARDGEVIDSRKRFLVALSFPGTQRDLVEGVASLLGTAIGRDRVLYDRYHTSEFARPNLDTYLQGLYRDESELVVVFLCADYATRDWPGLEWRAIRELIKARHDGSVMFVKLDDADVRGVVSVDGWLDAQGHDAKWIAGHVVERLKHETRNARHHPGVGPQMRYRVGNVEARVLVDLFGGGDDTFDRRSLLFEYQHSWVPLSPLIEPFKDTWVSEARAEASRQRRELFNGPCIRLHAFKPNVDQSDDGSERKTPILSFRPTCWFDYVASNRQLDREIQVGERISTLRAKCADETRLILSREIDWIPLSNILTVSLVFVTCDRWTIVGHRSNLVDNSAGTLQASAAENLHRWKDEPTDPGDRWSIPRSLADPNGIGGVTWDYEPKSAPNPFFTALRGVREEIAQELGEAIGVDDVTFMALAWDWLAFNPHLYAMIRTGHSKRDVERILAGARAPDGWEATPHLVRFEPTGDLKNLLEVGSWAEISKGAVLRALVHEFGYTEVSRALI